MVSGDSPGRSEGSAVVVAVVGAAAAAPAASWSAGVAEAAMRPRRRRWRGGTDVGVRRERGGALGSGLSFFALSSLAAQEVEQHIAACCCLVFQRITFLFHSFLIRMRLLLMSGVARRQK